ncbi:MAG: response regulator [Bacteroidales bacterium]|nr:response regulator [Bacteroidales bacterium]
MVTEKFINLKFDSSRFNSKIYKIVPGNDEGFFICSVEGLYKVFFNEQTYSIRMENVVDNFPAKSNFAKNIKDISISGDNYWVISHDELYQLKKNGKGQLYLFKQHKFNFFKRRMLDLEVKDDELYICQNNKLFKFKYNQHREELKLINTYDTKFFSKYSTINLTPDELLVKQLVIKNNKLYLATSLGLYILPKSGSTDDEIIVIDKLNDTRRFFNTNMIHTVFVDDDDILWVGIQHVGIKYVNLNEPEINIYNVPKSSEEKYKSITRFALAKNGDMWMSTAYNGIYQVRNHNLLRHYTDSKINAKKSLVGNRIMDMYLHEDDLWVSTTKGMNIISTTDGTTRKVLINNKRVFPGGKRYMDIAADKFDRIWCAVSGFQPLCLEQNEDKTFQFKLFHEPKYNTLMEQVNNSSSIYCDTTSNQILAGTNLGLIQIVLNDSGEVAKVRNYALENFNPKNHSIKDISKINDTLFALNVLNGVIHMLYGKNDSLKYHLSQLSSDQGVDMRGVRNVLEFQQQILITQRGIQLYNPQFGSVFRMDGFSIYPSNSFQFSSAYITKPSTLWLGINTGYMTIELKNTNYNQTEANLVLTGLKVNYNSITPSDTSQEHSILQKSISYTKRIELKHNQNNLQINCALLDYKNPKGNTYSYILEGKTSKWTYIQNPRMEFSNLTPGNYKLKVHATNSAGLKTKMPSILDIHIRPPLYSTWGFKVLYLIMFVVICYLVAIYAKKWLKLQHELRLNKKMHQLKLQFFTNIAHEIKTPLTLVIDPLKDLMSNTRYQSNKSIQSAYKNSQKIIELLNELIEFRKSETSISSLKAQFTNFNNYVNEMVKPFNGWALRKDIQLNVLLDSEPVELWLDHKYMEKIFNNLISNAIKYTAEEGTIVIETISDFVEPYRPKFRHTYRVSSKTNTGDYSAIRVYDSGIGISESSLPKIFERFYQVDSRQSKHIGSGVGLALVKNIVLQHSGEIIISSEKNKGTEYLIKLPKGDSFLKENEKLKENERTTKSINKSVVSIKEDVPRKTSKNKLSLQKSHTLLIADDDNDFREYVADKLSAKFYILEASDGREAWRLIQSHRPDVVISDWMMPHMPGINLLNKIKEDKTTEHIPFIMLTAKTGDKNHLEGVTEGAHAYLTKPITIELLEATLENLFHSKKIMLDGFVEEYFFELARHGTKEKDQDFIRKITEIIVLNLENTELGVDLISQKSGMSKTALYNKIKSLTNQSLKELIKHIKFKTAAKYLLEDGMSISEVAFKVGMSSASVFTRSFKDYFNCTPTEFVRKHTGKAS